MKKRTKILIAIIALATMLTVCVSCSARDMVGGAPSLEDYYNGYDKEGGFTGGSTVGSDVLDESRKIVKTVNEQVQTDRYDDFMAEMNATVTELSGYVTSASYRGDSYYSRETLRYATLTLRIPADRLSEFTAYVDGAGVVTSYTESIEDVTAAYVDVESRIAVLTAEETALLEMLEMANTVSTALEIRTRLNQVQGDIASLRAQKNTYDTLVAYSTVNLNVSEVRRAESTDPTFLEEIGYNFSDSITTIGEGLRDFAVWFIGDIIYILLVTGLLTGGFFAARPAIRRLLQRRKKGTEPQKPESSTPADEG